MKEEGFLWLRDRDLQVKDASSEGAVHQRSDTLLESANVIANSFGWVKGTHLTEQFNNTSVDALAGCELWGDSMLWCREALITKQGLQLKDLLL